MKSSGWTRITCAGAALLVLISARAACALGTVEVKSVRSTVAGTLIQSYTGKGKDALATLSALAKEHPESCLVHTGISRVLFRMGQIQDAAKEAVKAQQLLDGADDRDRRVSYAWFWHMRGMELHGAEAHAAFTRERSILDYALVLYPDDGELWLLRAEAAENLVHGAPFAYTARRMMPDDPVCKLWKPPVAPPCPELPLGPLIHLNALKNKPKLHEGLGKLTHPISTKNDLVRKYFEQGLRCFHAYVTPSGRPDSAANCFAQAVILDPHCAMAYWGLSFCLTQGDGITPMQVAHAGYTMAMQFGSDKERRYLAARVLELAGPQQRDAFIDALDAAITAYPEDIELWIWRGKIYGEYGVGSEEDMTLSEKVLAGMPFVLAAHKMQPDHPSPNHELIHDYEQIDRPALGWPYTLQFRDAAPNMPHANHMRSHLAMRLGRWEDALEATKKSVERSKAGFPELDPGHHLLVLLLALAHEGRFKEAQALANGTPTEIAWARMLRLRADAPAIREWLKAFKQPTQESAYIKVLQSLDDGQVKEAKAALDQLVKLTTPGRLDSEYRLREAKARYLCATDQVEAGLKLFRETSWASITDGRYHFFGGGGYFPEVWGEEALRRRKFDMAEIAFHEALAHEHGSIVAALGMQVVWESRGDAKMVQHYADRASVIWKNADPGAKERQLERLRKLVPKAAGLAAGLPAGSELLPFTSNVMTGPFRGTQHCYVCDAELNQPCVVVFCRKLDEATGKMLASLKAAALSDSKPTLMWFVFLGSGGSVAEAALEKQVEAFAANYGLTQLNVTVLGDPGGPPGYRVDSDAAVTALVARRFIVRFTKTYPNERWDASAASKEILELVDTVRTDKYATGDLPEVPGPPTRGASPAPKNPAPSPSPAAKK